MPRYDPAIDLRVNRVRAPAPVAQILVKPDRRALGIAKVEIEDRQADLPGELLDLAHDVAAKSAAARPRRDKGAGQGSGKGLRLVVARRPAQLRRAGDDAVEPADDEPALGDEQHALPIILEHLPRRRLQPAEPAAFGNGALGGLAEVVEIGPRNFVSRSTETVPAVRISLMAANAKNFRSAAAPPPGFFPDGIGCPPIVTPDHRRKRPAIIRARNEVGWIGQAEMIAVDKIGVHAGVEPGEERMRRPRLDFVPPNMGDLRRESAGWIAATSPPIQARPSTLSNSRPACAINCIPTQMPRNGRARIMTTSYSAASRPGDTHQPAPAIGERTDAGEDDAVRRGNCLRRARHAYFGTIRFSAAARSKALAAKHDLPEP